MSFAVIDVDFYRTSNAKPDGGARVHTAGGAGGRGLVVTPRGSLTPADMKTIVAITGLLKNRNDRPVPGDAAAAEAGAMPVTDGGQLRCWSDLVREVRLPADVAAAVGTGRPELLVPRAMTAAEVGQLMELVGVLIETNISLQRHSSTLLDMAEDAKQQAEGTLTNIQKLIDEADMRVPPADDDDGCTD